MNRRGRNPCRLRRLAFHSSLPVGMLVVILSASQPGLSEVRDGGINPAELGKGDWIYSVTDATNQLGGHIAAVTNETSLMLFYRSQGIRYLVVKAGTSDQLFKGCNSGPQFNRYLVDAAHTNGLWIFGYDRSYGSNLVGEVAVADYVFSQGADGYVWDAEAEWESSSPWIGSRGPEKAWRMCSTVRSRWPSKFLAHAPFPIISSHPSFPYKEFGYWCDAVMPQVYHSGWTNVLASACGAINWTDANWAAWQHSLRGSNTFIYGTRIWWTNAIKPLAPVAEVYGISTRSPCAGVTAPVHEGDLMEFLDYLSADPNCPTPGGYSGVSFWRADLHSVEQWRHIRASTFGAGPDVVKTLVLDDTEGVSEGTWGAVRTFVNGTFAGCGSGADRNSFGTNYLFHPRGSGASYVEFRSAITRSGDYDLYEWHPFRAEASARVPFIIRQDGASQTAYANEQNNSGRWNLLGRFHFAAGTDCTVRITDEIPEANGVALVDGLKLVYVSN